MNLEEFAAMTKGMVRHGTRRALIGGGLAALGLGALRAPWADEVAAAQKRSRRKPRAGTTRAASAAASNCTVCDDEDECPFTSVQAAITAAAAGSTITICKGTYKETITIAKNVSLVADEDGDVVLDGSDRATVVTVEPGVTALLQGLRIIDGRGRDGRTNGRGGGILNFGILTVRRCLIEDNKGQNGGGIANESGAILTLVNSRVQKNDGNARFPSPGPGPATQGGGIYNELRGLVTVDGSAIVENSANFGGGIANLGGMVITNRSSVMENEADLGGGGILSLLDLTISDSCVVADNEAEEDGGGLLITSGSATLTDVRIGENKARRGGGIAVGSPGGGTVHVQDTLVFRNDATDTGGGIFVSAGGRVTVDAESRVVGNDPNNCVGTDACRA